MRLTAALLVLLCTHAAAEKAPLWLVVAPKSLAGAVAPLAKHRAAQGLRTLVHEGPVEAALAKHEPDYLLLVGDHAPGAEDEPWYVAAPRVKLYRWRKQQSLDFASDVLWADRDKDGYPDCAVGRIPARTPAQVAEVVRKTIAYETRALTPDDLRLVVWAGAPGYGAFVDAMATRLLISTVRTNAPAWISPWMISADLQQPLCGWPQDHAAKFCAALRKGAAIGAIIAHGNADLTVSMKHNGKVIVFRADDAARHLKGTEPCAPLVLLACNCGEHDGKKPALGERLLFLPGGPVATIGATTESHPLTNYYTGVCLLRSADGRYGRRERLGALWLTAQRKAAEQHNRLIENMLKDAEGKLEKEIDTKKLRADQQRMYALLGDPALRLPVPRPLKAKLLEGGRWTAERVAGAKKLHISYRVHRPPVIAPGADPEARRAAFRKANAAEGYAHVRTIDGDAPWTGAFEKKGRYRLVAAGPGGLYACVLDVR